MKFEFKNQVEFEEFLRRECSSRFAEEYISYGVQLAGHVVQNSSAHSTGVYDLGTYLILNKSRIAKSSISRDWSEICLEAKKQLETYRS